MFFAHTYMEKNQTLPTRGFERERYNFTILGNRLRIRRIWQFFKKKHVFCHPYYTFLLEKRMLIGNRSCGVFLSCRNF